MKHTRKWLLALFIVPMIGLFALANPAEAATRNVSASYQAFDGGIMLWESSEGGIWVLVNNGPATYYPQSSYEARPDNPVTDPPPSNRVRPINGFGKVWGNYAAVRNSLGWALASEQGYTATINEVRALNSYLAEVRINLPTGGSVTIDPYQRIWTGTGTNPGPTSTRPPASPTYTPNPPSTGYIPPFSDGSSIASTLQTFENGFMIWIAGTGDIFVFNASTQNYQRFPVWSYAGQSDNPVTTQPPAGRFKPYFGFGKVWGHNPLVRSQLGWATSNEQGFLMPFTRSFDPNLGRETFGLDTGSYHGYIRLDPATNTWVQAVP